MRATLRMSLRQQIEHIFLGSQATRGQPLNLQLTKRGDRDSPVAHGKRPNFEQLSNPHMHSMVGLAVASKVVQNISGLHTAKYGAPSF